MPTHVWEWPAHTLVVVPLAVLAYAAAARLYPPSRGRAAAFGAGLLLVIAVLNTPLETIAVDYLLTVHLLQNVVLAEWAPALFVVALSPALARRLEGVGAVRVLTLPLVALPLWLATYFAWHVPALYDYALRHEGSWLHVEHASYLAAGLLVWWPIVHGRLATGAKSAYTFAAFVLASPLGLLLALLPRPVYEVYVEAPRLWGLSPLADQQLAGATMAAEQAIVFFAVFAVLFLRFLQEEQAAGVTAGAAK